MTPWTVARQASLSLTISQSLVKFMFIASVILSSHLILWHPLFLLPSICPSIRDFSSELSVRIRWTKYWSFSFSISPSGDYSGLISLKIDWFDLLAVQGVFSSTTVRRHQFFGVLPSLWSSSHSHILGKTVALTIQTFVGRLMSLIFNTLSRLSSLSSQEAIIFWFHGCSHHPPWFWSLGRGKLSLLPPFPLLFAIQ